MQQREPGERITGAWSGPSGRVSVLVPTSAVPTNPSTEHLEAALASVARHPLLAAAPKLVIFDALPAAAHLERYKDPKWRTFWTDPGGYAEYREAVIARCARGAAPFQNTRGLVMPRFSHVTGGLRAALHHVTTRHVLVVQHDLELIRAGELPVEGILDALDRCPDVRLVLLNRWRNDHANSRTWFRLRPELEPRCGGAGGLPRLTAVQGFTDQVHFARADHYREVLLPRCRFPDVPENTLHPASLRADHAEFGSWALGGPQDGPFISFRHSSRLAVMRAALERNRASAGREEAAPGT